MFKTMFFLVKFIWLFYTSFIYLSFYIDSTSLFTEIQKSVFINKFRSSDTI